MKYLFLIAVFFLLIWILRLPSIRRRKLLLNISNTPFPKEWKAILVTEVAWYHLLSSEEKEAFEKRIQMFLATKQIIGIRTNIDDRIKVLTAASAIIPVFSFPDWNYRKLSQVFIVDGNVKNEDIKGGYVLGEVKVTINSGIMTLSKQALEQGFKNINDKKNVGIHEFAHIFDGADGIIDGIPSSTLPDELIQPWCDLMMIEMEKIAEGDSDINSYGATKKVEFFAVVSEYFFERPDVMRERHPKIYNLLSIAYQQEHSKSSFNLAKMLRFPKQNVGRNDPCPCGSTKKYKQCCLKHNL